MSVVVTARNAAGSIGALLDALEGQTLPSSRFELVVVDDASTDATAEVVGARGWPRLIDAGAHVRRGGGRNLAAAEARADLLAMIDADCVPDPDWLERGLARFDADPELGVLGGRITIALPRRPSLAALLDAATYLTQRGNAAHGWAVTASLWIRRESFERAGGFNERLHHAGEDLELCRCVAATEGGRIEFAAEVHATHPPRSSLREAARKAYRVGLGRAELRRYARVPIGDRPAALDPRSYVPRSTLRRMPRLRDRGIEVGPATRLRMAGAELAFMSLPRIAGELAGTISGVRARRRPVGS